MSINRTATIFTPGITGAIIPYAGLTAPTDWLVCDGKNSHLQSDYPRLFSTIMPSKGTFTVTIASPAVVTLNNHGLLDGDQVVLTSTGSLPTGLTKDTVNYYVKSPTVNTFNLSTSRTTAGAGSALNTSGTQSGTHTLYYAPYGAGSGSTTFSVPDLRGKVAVGMDNYATTQGDAGYLSTVNIVGLSSGEENHTLLSDKSTIPAHSHSITDELHAHNVYTGNTAYNNNAINGGDNSLPFGGATVASATGVTTQNRGGGGSHNNMQPYVLTIYIIKT